MGYLCRSGAAAAAMLVICGSASAVTLRFGGVTNNNDNNTGTGEQQLTLDIFDSTGGERDLEDVTLVSFLIQNTGESSSTVSRVLFDDFTSPTSDYRESPVLGGVNQIINGPGVFFVQSEANTPLPGDETWTTDFGFVAVELDREIDPPGIDPGQSLLIEFELAAGLTFEDLLDALINGALRIGLIAEFPDGSFESFAADPSSLVVPLPTGGAMGLAGLGLLAARRRRR